MTIASKKLRELRNKVPIDRVIVALEIPAKRQEGYLRFLCPLCGEFNTATNLRTNLARCFRCEENFDPIDLVIATKSLRVSRRGDSRRADDQDRLTGRTGRSWGTPGGTQ